MRYLLIITGILLISASVAGAAVTAQISKEMDASGKWTNWENQVIPEIETVPAPPGDHNSVDDDTAQDWYIPNWVAGKITHYVHVRFEVADFQGQYAFRVSFSEGLRWSPLETCLIRFIEQDTILIHTD